MPRRRTRLAADPIAEATRLWREHGWTDAADGMAAITSLMRAQQIVLARVDAALKPFGVTFARYEVLMLLHFSRSPALPMSVIGDRLQVHPTSVTNAVDRLQESGLVSRETVRAGPAHHPHRPHRSGPRGRQQGDGTAQCRGVHQSRDAVDRCPTAGDRADSAAGRRWGLRPGQVTRT